MGGGVTGEKSSCPEWGERGGTRPGTGNLSGGKWRMNGEINVENEIIGRREKEGTRRVGGFKKKKHPFGGNQQRPLS